MLRIILTKSILKITQTMLSLGQQLLWLNYFREENFGECFHLNITFLTQSISLSLISPFINLSILNLSNYLGMNKRTEPEGFLANLLLDMFLKMQTFLYWTPFNTRISVQVSLTPEITRIFSTWGYFYKISIPSMTWAQITTLKNWR